jgi:aspartyl-tRNA(Asn)/glutamyl-tRNA(Gln) amidotransferase subunit C
MRSGIGVQSLGEDEIRTTAEMARLALAPGELAQLAGELSSILGYVEQLQEVDVSGVAPTTHAVPMSCPLRGDLPEPHDPTETALRNAPARESAFFTVPAIFAGGAAGSEPGGEG